MDERDKKVTDLLHAVALLSEDEQTKISYIIQGILIGKGR